MAATVFDILMRLDTSGFRRGMQGAADDTDLLASSVKTLAGFLAGIGLAEMGRQMLLVSADFDDALTQINTLVGVSREEIKEWRAELLKLGPQLGKGPVELAKALYTITGAGARGAEALEVLTEAARASSLGMGDTQTVAKAVVAALESYGRANLSAADATEILRNAVREGNADATELAPTLGKVTGLAATMGVSFGEVTGYIAKFSKTGGSAAEGVSALRGTLAALLDGSAPTIEALRNIGLSLDDVRASIRERGLAATLVDLREKIGDDQEALSKLLPQVEALSGLLNVIASDSGADYLRTVEAVTKTTGDMAAVFEQVRASSPGQAMLDLQARAESLKISVGDGLAKAFLEAVTGLGSFEEQQVAAERIGRQLGEVLGHLIDGLNLLAENAALVEGAFKGWIALNAISFVNSLILSVGNLSVAMIALAGGQASVAASSALMVSGLGAVLVAVLAINTAIEQWSATMQREIDQMVADSARFAQVLHGTRGAVAAALASGDKGTISAELAKQEQAFADAEEAAGTYRAEVDKARAELARLKEVLKSTGHALSRAAMKEQADSVAKLEQSWNEANARLKTAGKAVSDLNVGLKTAVDEHAVLAGVAGKSVAEIEQAIREIQKSLKKTPGDQAAVKTLQILQKALEQAKASTRDYGEEVQKATANLKAQVLGLEAQRRALGLVEEPMISLEERAEALRKSAQQIAELELDPNSAKAKEIEALHVRVGALDESVGKLGNSIDDTFRDKLREAEITLRSLGATSEGTISALNEIALTAAEEFEVLLEVSKKISELKLDPGSEKAKALREEALAAELAAKKLKAYVEIQRTAIAAQAQNNFNAVDFIPLQLPKIATSPSGNSRVMTDLEKGRDLLEDWASAGFEVADAFSEIDSSLGEIIGSAAQFVDTLSNARDQAGKINAAIAGAQFAQAIGNRATGGQNYAAEGSAVGALVGAAIASYFTAGIGAAGGAAIGSAVGGAIGSFVKKGLPEFLGAIRLEAGKALGSATVVEGEMRQIGAQYTSALTRGINAALADLGGDIQALPQLELKIRDGVYSVFSEGIVARFESMQEAVDFAILQALREGTITGLSTEVRSALLNSTAESFSDLAKDLDFARAIEKLPEVGEAISEAGDFIVSRIDTFRREMKRAAALGIGGDKLTQDLNRDLAAYRRQLLGIEETIEERLLREQEGFNREILLIKAEQTIKEAELQQRAALLRAEVALLQAKGEMAVSDIRQTKALVKTEVDFGHTRLQTRSSLIRAEVGLGGVETALWVEQVKAHGVKLQAEARLTEAEYVLLEQKLAMLAAVESALETTSSILANLPDIISDSEIQDAINRANSAAGGGDVGIDSSASSLEQFRERAADLALELSGLSPVSLDTARAIRDLAQELEDAAKAGASAEEIARYRADSLEKMERDLLDRSQSVIAGNSGLSGGFRALVDQIEGDFSAAIVIALIGEAGRIQLESFFDDALASNDPAALRELANLLAGIGLAEIPFGVRELLDQIPDLGDRVAEAIDSMRESIMGSVQQYLDLANGVDQWTRKLLDVNAQFDEARERLAVLYGAGGPRNPQAAITIDDFLPGGGGPSAVIGDRPPQAAIQELAEALGDLGIVMEGGIESADDYERALAELDRAQHAAAQQIALDFIGSLDALGVALPIEQTMALARAQFELARMQALSAVAALMAAGAFEGLPIVVDDLLEAIANATFENSTFFPQQQNQGNGGAANDNDDAAADLRADLLDTLRQWRESGISPVTRQAMELTRQLQEVRDQARLAGVSLAEVDSAFAVMRATFIRDQLQPYLNLADPIRAEYQGILDHFADLANAFREIGASSADMLQLEEARQNAIADFYERIDSSAQSLLDRLTGGDLSTGTNRQQYESALAEFQALQARLQANPQDFEARSQIAAAGERLLETAQAYNSGALYNQMAGLVQSTLLALLAGPNVAPFPIPGSPGLSSDIRTTTPLPSPGTFGGSNVLQFPPRFDAPGSAPIASGGDPVVSLLREIRDELRRANQGIMRSVDVAVAVGNATVSATRTAGVSTAKSVEDVPVKLARAMGSRR
jgi:TP901 family phage tail tape measure protein